MKQELANFLKSKGFIEIHSSLPEFSFYFHLEHNYVNVIHVVDYQRDLYIAKDQFESIKGKIFDFFEEKQLPQIHILSLILSSDLPKAQELKADDKFCWILSKETRDLISTQSVEDFYGMKGEIRQFLEQIELWFEMDETKSTNENNSMETDSKETKTGGITLQKVPYINITMVILNVLIFIICTFTGELLYNKYMLRFTEVVFQGEYYRLFTAMFLHIDTQHLMNNMIILLFLGNMLEEHLGHRRYFLLYLLSGLGGGILSLVYQSFFVEPTGSVGASGGIFGLLGIVLVLAIVEKGKMEYLSITRISIVIIFSVYSGFTSSNIDNAAHIGGLLTGFLVTGFLYLINLRKGMVKK